MEWAHLKPIRPLIIEDEKNALEAMLRVFDTIFDEFYTAHNGEEGLYRFYKDAPDIIITDLQMPFMGGFRMLERIRMENATIPIIIASAHSTEAYLEHAKELKINEYLTKPYSIDLLFKKIHQCCHQG
jgi:YesN/AraC family two-component response regulator